MVTSRHSANQIAAFTDGETRFIAAAYRDPEQSAGLFVMPDGQASLLREFTREQLRCLIPACAAPEIVAVSRARRRDGFSHRSGAGRHAPETVNHLQGKAIVAEWLRTVVPHSAVEVEAATDTQRSRVADVLVSFPGDFRVAFEIQYARITVEEWTARHESYQQQSVVDIWLWGHTRLHRSRSSYDPPFRLDDVQDAVRERGLPVQWLNPDIGEVATAVTVGEDPITTQDRFCDVLIEALAGCEVTPDGIQSGALRELAMRTNLWFEAKQEAERREQARIAEHQRRKAEDLKRWQELRRRTDEANAAYAAAVAAGTVSVHPMKYTGARPICKRCGKPMDPVLAGSGFHITCEPGYWLGRTKPR